MCAKTDRQGEEIELSQADGVDLREGAPGHTTLGESEAGDGLGL